MLGELLRQLRQQQGLTLKQLAEQYQRNKGRGSIDAPLLSRYENGFYQLSKDRLLDILSVGLKREPREVSQVISQYIVTVEQKNLPAGQVSESNLEMIPVYDSLASIFLPSNAKHIIDYASKPLNVSEDSQQLAMAKITDESQHPGIDSGDLILMSKRTTGDDKVVIYQDGEQYRIARAHKATGKIKGKVLQLTKDLA